MKNTLSPLPSKNTAKMLDFPDAMKEIMVGKKIHKLEWSDKNYYGTLKDGMLQIHKPDNKFYQWVISEGDLIGKDYIVL